MKLEGRTALVTGSNRGIGRGIAVELARAGADVAVHYRSHEDEANDVAEEVRKLGRKALVIQADVSQPGEGTRVVEEAIKGFGHLDICVNNVAYSIRKPSLEISRAEVQKTLDASLLSAFEVAQTTLKHMVDRKYEGALLMVSSVHAFIPVGKCVAYNMAKAALNHMAFTLADEMCEHRIRINVLEPGWIDTPGERTWTTEEQIREQQKKLPWGRIGSIEEMGKVAVFLCSDDASYVHGASLRADGGYWLPCRSVATSTSD